MSTLLGWKLDPERTNLAQSCLFYHRHICPLKLIHKDEFWSIFYSVPVDEIYGKTAYYEHLSVFGAAKLVGYSPAEGLLSCLVTFIII